MPCLKRKKKEKRDISKKKCLQIIIVIKVTVHEISIITDIFGNGTFQRSPFGVAYSK